MPYKSKDIAINKAKEYYRLHRQERLAKAKEYRQTHKIQVQEYNAAWREKNREKLRIAARKYYRQHAEERKAYARKRRAEHPEVRQEYVNRNRKRINKLQQARYRKTPERFREQSRKWREANRELIHLSNVQAYARCSSRMSADAAFYAAIRRKARINYALRRIRKGLGYSPKISTRIPDYIHYGTPICKNLKGAIPRENDREENNVPLILLSANLRRKSLKGSRNAK